jgi:colanic acid/amylovoran biosynthesis glycosyltransferase
MQKGMDRWTFREIEALAEERIRISIFPTKCETGPYMPKPDWDCYVFKKWLVGLRQAWWLGKSPFTYIRLLFEALRTSSLVDFLLACDFAHHMVKIGVIRIHCVFGDHKLFIGYYCKRILGIPLSVALYGYDLRANPNWRMFRRAVRLCDDIIVNCEFNRHLLEQVAGSEVARDARVIRHYADIPAGNSAGKVKVLIVGGFRERKGHDLLFRAVQSLTEEAGNVEVWVAGYKGPVDVEQLARDFGVADKVRVFGEVSDRVVDLLFEECDIFCLPSRTDKDGVNEGLPVALIEAMAHAKPVITTRLGGIPELVAEILIEEGDVRGLADALKRYVLDPRLRGVAGARNRDVVRARYSKQNITLLRDLFLETQYQYPATGLVVDHHL